MAIFSTTGIRASVWVVPDDFPTIQAAVDAAANNDTILISPGEYYESIIIGTKNIVIGSMYLTSGDTSYTSQTIINGQGSNRGFSISDVEFPSRISGLTVKNCRADLGGGLVITDSEIALDHIKVIDNFADCSSNSASKGGGMAIYDSEVSISDFDISNNESYCTTPPINPVGGGVYAFNTNLTLVSGKINSNSAYLGGGVYLAESYLISHSVNFQNNTAPYLGGAICSFGSNLGLNESRFSNNSATGSALYTSMVDSVWITNCLFTANQGRVINSDSTELTVINSSFIDNSGTTTIDCFTHSTLHLMNSILWNNNEVEIEFSSLYNTCYLGYNTLKGGMAGISGDIAPHSFGPTYSAEPLFENDTSFALSDSSYCIGAGIDTVMTYPHLSSPEIDIMGNTRPAPDGSMPDLGAFENLLGSPITHIAYPEDPSNSIRVSPNPSYGNFEIDYSSAISVQSINIYSTDGRLIHSEEITGISKKSIVIDMQEGNLKGLMFVEILTDKVRMVEKVVLF
jgi:predicted outer membrane repeat protein